MFSKNYIYIYCLLFILQSFLSYRLVCEQKSYRIFFIDKGNEEFSPGSKLWNSTLNILSDRAKKRRLKVLSNENIIGIDDIPLYKPYIDFIKNLGAEIIHQIRWQNYAVVRCDSSVAEQIKGFTFIKTVTPTSTKSFPLLFQNIKTCLYNPPAIDLLRINCGNFSYGESYLQASMINVPNLHEMGFTGAGVLIGILDNGFKWRQHEALINTNVIAEYDFIQNDSITYNQPGDIPNQDGHGTLVLSIAAGLAQGKLIGIAPSADYILAKTEDISFEQHIEEDHYAAAIEWLESNGVDITSSSLGYFRMDSTEEKYQYSDLDGKSTIIDRAVNNATRKGVFCITAAGNSGPLPKTLSSPADADSIIAIGSMQNNGKLVSGFSSRGPRTDGVIKPDLTCLGDNVVCANSKDSTGYLKVAGTSLATPLIAGAAALILSASPGLKPWELRNILKESASNFNNPNDSIGWGIPDISNALKKSTYRAISPISTFSEYGFQRILVYILGDNITNAKIWIKFDQQASFSEFKLLTTSIKNLWEIDVPLNSFTGNSPAQYYLDVDGERKPFKSDSFNVITPGVVSIPCGVDRTNFPSMADINIEAFVYPSLIDNGTLPKLTAIVKEPSKISLSIYNSISKLIMKLEPNDIFNGYATFDLNKQINKPYLSSGAYFIDIKFIDNNSIINRKILKFVVVNY
jgi:serine protease AprX